MFKGKIDAWPTAYELLSHKYSSRGREGQGGLKGKINAKRNRGIVEHEFVGV